MSAQVVEIFHYIEITVRVMDGHGSLLGLLMFHVLWVLAGRFCGNPGSSEKMTCQGQDRAKATSPTTTPTPGSWRRSRHVRPRSLRSINSFFPNFLEKTNTIDHDEYNAVNGFCIMNFVHQQAAFCGQWQ